MADTFLIAVIAAAIAAIIVGEAAIMRSLVSGYGYLRRLRRRGGIRLDTNTILKSPLTPPVSVIGVPPDAGPASLRFVRDLARLHYGNHEVLVVLDGPSQGDLEVWIKEFDLFPSSRGASGDIPTRPVAGVYESRGPFRLTFVEKERGGLADCLNAGLNIADAELIGVADPHSLVAPETLLRVVLPFLERPTTTIGSCTAAPPEAPNIAARFYALECTRLWLGRAAGLGARGAALPAPGSFSLIDRKALRQAHGFDSSAFEMIFHLHAMIRARGAGYEIAWVDRDVARPVSPASFGELRQATVAGQRETIRTVRRHLTVLGSLGGLGRIAMPGLIFTGIVRPLLETGGYACAALAVARGTVPWQMAGLLVVGACGFGMLNSMLAVLLREYSTGPDQASAELSSLFLAAIPENFGYRQLRNLWLLGAFFNR